MDGSPIQWCDDTVNPTMGCDGCELWGPERKTCYAGTLHDRHGGRNSGYARRFEVVELFPGRVAAVVRRKDLAGLRRIRKPWLDGSPRLVFVSDMSDALSKEVSFEYLEMEIVNEVSSSLGLRHRWLWLTKRPGRMAKFSAWLDRHGVSWPQNLWAGTSITTAASLNRIDDLLRVGDEHTLRFLSVEPQTEHVDLGAVLDRLDWVIQGGESGDSARPFHIEWALELMKECRRRRVPYFLKQLGAEVFAKGKKVKLGDSHGGEWNEWPSRLRVRQVPTVPSRRWRAEVRQKASMTD